MSSVGSSSPYSTTHPIVSSASSHLTSNAALRIALTAMKERCQQLQNRLSMMEEENLQLRIERHSIPGVRKDSDSDVQPLPSLHRKIEELSRQKSKLSHHIYLVANENKNLWETLSRLTDERNDITSPGSSSSIGALKPIKSLRTVSTYQEGHQLSLDEVPLKMSPFYTHNLNTNLEDWNATTSIKECEYPIMDVEDDEEEMDDVVRSELMTILGTLEEEKKLLQKQQHDLKQAVDTITKFSRVNVRQNSTGHCEAHDSRGTMEEYEQLHSVGSDIDETNRSEGEILKIANGIQTHNKESNFEDRICPLCTKFYAKSTPFDEFNDHVLSHFVEDSEQDSHLSFHEIVA